MFITDNCYDGGLHETHPVLGFWVFRFRISSFGRCVFRCLGFRLLVSGSGIRVFGLGFEISNVGFPVLGLGNLVFRLYVSIWFSWFRFRVSDVGFEPLDVG